MKKTKKRLLDGLYRKFQKLILEDITSDLGEVKIYDDKIVCFVDNKNLKKYRKGKHLSTYNIYFKTKKMYSENAINLYELNKPIHYIVDGMNFNNATVIVGPEDSIHFKNCTFNDGFDILTDGEVIFENNKYKDSYGIYTSIVSGFFKARAKSITFINDRFINRTDKTNKTRPAFNVDIIANNITIKNSTFDLKEDDGEISIKTENLLLQNSDIKCSKKIKIEAQNIDSENSLVLSNSSLIINAASNKNILSLASPEIIFNGTNMTKYSTITRETLNLQKSRTALIEQLKALRDCCVLENDKEIENQTIKLNKRSVEKTLRK